MPETVEADQFAIALDEMLSDVADTIARGLPKAVRASLQAGRREAIQNAESLPVHKGKTMDAYVGGFHTHVRDSARHVEGVLSNDDMPGLVHLLEKGHAKVGGGRVSGYPHIAPAKEVTDRYLTKRVENLVDEAIR